MSGFTAFTKKSVGTLTLGERLKRFRSDRRLSLTEVSRGTQIQMKYLESLESGDYDSLPADVYTRGFLKNYAEFIGVDEKAFIRLFEKEKGIRKNLEKGKNGPEDKIKALNISSFTFTPKKMITAVSVLAVALIVFFIYREAGTFNSAPRLVVISPEANLETSEQSVSVEGLTEKDAKLYINDQAITINDEGKFKEDVPIQPGANVINLKAVNKFDKETKQTINIQSNFQQVAGAEDSVDPTREEANNSGGINMEMRVNPGPTWVNVEADGSLVFSGIMLSDTLQNFEAKDKIIVSSAKASTTFIKLNGKDLGALGKDPVAIKGVVFDKNTK